MKNLDCRTLPCPQPVMRCRQMLEEEHPATLRVLLDNEAAVENVRRFLSQRHYVVEESKKGDVFVLTATSQIAPTAEQAEQVEKLPSDEERQKILVFITTPNLGRGDDILGGKLMDTFLATLPEMGESLWRIVLLNGGVKLAAEEGPALQSLCALEEQGVSVLVCGTCLAHYGLAQHKKVGQTSNMLDIITSLELASKVIRP